MKKILTLAAVLVAALAMNAADPVMIRVDAWSQEGLTKAGDSIIASFTRDGIQVLALDTKSDDNKYNKFVAIEDKSEGWKLDDLTFTSRLKMRGKSTKDSRQIIIPVKNGDKVEIVAQSGKSSEERTFEIGTAQWDGKADTKGTEFKTPLESKLALFEYNATAEGNIYIWCPSKEVNFFAFRITSTATNIDNTAVEGKVVKTFENGQLVVIKNGVKYNATGSVIR